jgi:hypothetical protein
MAKTFIEDFSQVIAPATQYDFIDMYVPANSTLIVKSFGNDLSNVAGWTFTQWQLLKNGMAQYPMDAIFDQMGYAAQRQQIQQLKWQGGDRFQLRGLMAAAGPAGCAVLVSIEYDIVDND